MPPTEMAGRRGDQRAARTLPHARGKEIRDYPDDQKKSAPTDRPHVDDSG